MLTAECQGALAGKVAVVTGASRNIGAAIARGYVRAGATVIMVARDRERLAAAADRAAECGDGVAVPVECDVTVLDRAQALVASVLSEHGRVDVLVNNAAAVERPAGRPILELDDEAWTRTIDANIRAPYRLCQGFGRSMLEAEGGSIINVISGAGLLPARGVVAYGSTKAALWMLTRYLAAELAPAIRVNALCPGIVNENGRARSATGDAMLAGDVPFGRAGHPEEMIGAAVYLASDAASYTTGALLVCNGGRPW